MSKNLKDLIERAEDKQNTHAHFVSKIESLQMKVAKLETKLEAQKESSKPKKPKKGKPESEEIDLLKEQISSQKQEHEVQLLSHTYLIKDYERLEKLNKSLDVEIFNIDNKNKLLLETIKKNERDSKKHLNALEKENKSSIDNLEKTIQNLKKQLNDLEKENKSSIDNLEKAIYDLESMNSETQKENQKLTAKLNTVEADRSRLRKFEEKAYNLEKEVQALQKENEELKQKDAVLLAKTINIMEDRKKEPIEISLEDEILKEEEATRKKVCPNCGVSNKDFIREIDDKTKIIYTHPKIYGKMYRCGQCGTEWH